MGKTQYILLVEHMDDKKARYLTAKKLAQLFPQKPFARWKAELDATGVTVVTRSDTMAGITSYKESLEMVGAQLDVRKQESIGGSQVF